MKEKKLLFFGFILTVCLLVTGVVKVLAQSSANTSSETFENVYEHWFIALDKTRLTNSIDRSDFDLFTRFSQKEMDSLRGDFINRIGTNEVTTMNVGKYESVLEKAVLKLYRKYEDIKQRYPSSVDEFRNQKAPYLTESCDSACDNINFESGNLSGWNAYYGANASNTSFNIVDITGGPAGAVTHAANDTLTSTSGFYVMPSGGCFGPNPRPDYQVNITSGSLHDAMIPSIPEVSPFGGHYSVMLGDSTEINYGAAILSQTFLVGTSNANFTYQYAVFLANPIHTYYHQPFFKVAVLDASGDTIPFCGEYNVVSGNGTQQFDSTNFTDAFACETFVVYYKNWTIVNVPLTKYIGQCVTVVFEVADCSQGGHFGYAYVDASCGPLNVISSSQNFCGQDSIELTGPGGEGHYEWTGPTNGIKSNDTLQQISIDSSGTYTLVITPFTGATCNDTLTIKIGKVTGTPPHPDFKADTGCAGLPLAFINTSTPISGAKFYWDFYNNGSYEDSAVNPSWTYNLPGTYTVKLEEIYNGCGSDTLITVVIDSTVGSSFIADTVCYNDTTQFTNTSSGGLTYYWSFGDPSSGANNTSSILNPGHVYTAPGTYTVSLIGKHGGWCNDTVKGTVTVLDLPKPTISGSDSMCSGNTAIINAGGGSVYSWNTGATTSSITVHPTSTTTYTVQVSNGKCYIDTTYTLFVKPLGVGSVSGKTSVCYGDTIFLTATGGGTYLWNTGATTSSIIVPANSFNDTAYSVIISNGDSCLTIHQHITVDSLYSYGCCSDTIFSGNATTLQAGSGAGYYWIPPTGLSCDTCPNPIANPTVTTTYTLITTTDAGCTASSLVTVTVDIPCNDFFVPNVFTPNGDGKNDTYYINAEFMPFYQIDIYNRWGKEIFTSKNPETPWDGNIDGMAASAGVYYYIIRATCINGTIFDKQGFVQLIR